MKSKDKEFITSVVTDRIVRLKSMLGAERRALKALENDDFCYVVTLTSLWADCGEKTSTADGQSLSEAVKRAEDMFRKLNNRSDIQAARRYAIRFPSGSEVELPTNPKREIK